MLAQRCTRTASDAGIAGLELLTRAQTLWLRWKGRKGGDDNSTPLLQRRCGSSLHVCDELLEARPIHADRVLVERRLQVMHRPRAGKPRNMYMQSRRFGCGRR